AAAWVVSGAFDGLPIQFRAPTSETVPSDLRNLTIGHCTCVAARPGAFLMAIDANNLPIIFTALEFAARKHLDQRRKDAGASRYINHPIAVAHVLCEAGVDDPEVLSAALLHDTIEDTQTTEAELREIFGDRIASIVLEMTDDKSLKKEERKRLQIE